MLLELLLAALLGPQATPPSAAPVSTASLDYDFYMRACSRCLRRSASTTRGA